jgi:hypothetical protein
MTIKQNPESIKIKNIHSFRLNEIDDEILNVFVMKNGIIYTLEPLLIPCIDLLSEILPMEKMVHVVDDEDKETASELVKKPKPPRFLKEFHPIKR